MEKERIYIDLLRKALGFSHSKVELTDLSGVLQLAARQGTLALIAEELLSDYSDGVDEKTKLMLKQHCATNFMQQQLMSSAMQRAVTALTDAGIRSVMIKGFTLARLYAKPYLREWGDVDLFVGKEAYHPGAAALRAAFPEAALFEAEEDHYKHYNITLERTAVEMHRVSASFAHPRDARIYDALEQDALVAHAYLYQSAEEQWYEPEWRFNVLFVFFHSWEHFVDSRTAMLRQFCDLALLLSKGKPDNVSYADLATYLQTNLRKLHLLEVWKLYAYIMVHYLGLPESQCPLYTDACREKAEALFAAVLNRPAKRPKEKDTAPKNIILRKLYTFRLRWHDAWEIARFEPVYARHMVATTIAQSWDRFKRGENTRKWE